MKIKQLKEMTILYPEENLIGEAVADLNKELDNHLNNKNSNLFLINLKNVSQIDSYALSILATFGNELNPRGGKLFFSNLQPFIHSIFKMMRMDDIFEIFEEEQEAIEKFNA